MEEDSRRSELSNVIRIDDRRVREHLGRIVRGTVEETLNASWKQRLTGCAMRGATSGQKRAAITLDNRGLRKS